MKLLCVLVVCALFGASIPLPAQAAVKQYQLNIPRQSLDSALKEFAKQTGLQVARFTDTGAAADVGPISGEFPVEEALRELLEESGLTFEVVNERTIAVVSPADRREPAQGLLSAHETKVSEATKEESRSWFRRLMLAQAQNDQSSSSRTSDSGQQEENSSQSSDKRPEGRVIEEIIVTAQKREERLQDVPISISVLRGDDLDRSTARDVTEALSRVSGVSILPLAFTGTSSIAIRGVGSPLPILSGGATTAYYLDSVPFAFVKSSFVPDPDVYDLDRVEVLRGPQGTLYGASALNGVARVLTKDPDLNELGFKARGLTSNTRGGGWNYRGEAAVNLPIVEGKLAARAVVGFQDWSGWIDKPHREDGDDSERRTVRLKIKAQPTEQLSIGGFAWRSRNDFDNPSTGVVDGENFTPIDEPQSSDFDAYGFTVDYDFVGFSIASSTSYIDYENRTKVNIRPLVTPPGTVGPLDDPLILAARTFAQELTLRSTDEGLWRWSLGGIYRDSEDKYFEVVTTLPSPAEDHDLSKSYAVFGELTRMFWDGKLQLTAGLRYFEDDVEIEEKSRFDGTPADQLIESGSEFHATTPRVILGWHLNEQIMTYASYSQGFRSGLNQSSGVLTVGDYPPAKADKLTNYEVGAKGSLLNGRINFDTAVYYMDWKDVQLQVPVLVAGTTFLPAYINGDSVSGMGFDFGLATQPFDRFNLGVNFSWNDLTYDSDVYSRNTILRAKGDRLVFSPESTVSASADYVWPLGGNGFEGTLSASANYTAATERVQPNFVIDRNDSLLFGRASFSIRAPDHWSATLFVDNINNERGSPAKHSRRPEWQVQVRPRTLGLALEYAF